MLDITNKIKTLRTAVAEATVHMSPDTILRINNQTVPKGNPLEVAKVAAVQAAKNTSQIIPYCHPLPVDFVGVEYQITDSCVRVIVTVKAIYKTGVEMEAMTAASVCALTLYDMLKMLDETMTIQEIKLISKRGGKSDFREHFKNPVKAAVLVMSDTIYAGKKADQSGKLIVERLVNEGIDVVSYEIIPDETDIISNAIVKYADNLHLDLIVTTGGTGFSPRDTTPEAVLSLLTREIPGVGEALRAYGQERTPYSMLSRAIAGLRGNTLIVTLPGSKNGVKDSLDALFPALLHAFKMVWGGLHPQDDRKTIETHL